MKLLILPGDGIGPELCQAAEKVLKALDTRFSLNLQFEHALIGFDSLEKNGSTLPDAVIEMARQADGVVLGPVSHADYPPKEQGGINPSGGLRMALDLFANIRPSVAFKGVDCLAPDMDLIIVRENTEGFYADRTMFAGSGEMMPDPDLALAVRKISREGSRRVVEAASKLALGRRKKLTIVHKANVLKLSDGLFLDAADEVLKDFPEIEADDEHVDAMASLLVREPGSFDVIVTTNMFGDILSNEAAELSGGLGLGGSINAGHEHAVAQAAHGSAPDIAGQDLANPVALIKSTGMLLDWLGQRHGRNDFGQAAAALDETVKGVLKTPESRTRDLGGVLGTKAFAALLAQTLSDA
ncbi:MAG: isocitrate/isopropylmalate dehydrogenase family protein [Rhodospirillales bacterium]|nr:isocitrate/isopropylmalate dehydrogenase family protein [Rhodospirillales bacterium]